MRYAAGEAGTSSSWHAGKPRALGIDQPLSNYERTSLQGVVGADGSAWIVLKIDPVNPDAVARQKADPEYLDVFARPPTAKPFARPASSRPIVRHRFGVIGDRFWLIERNNGFERGGRSVAIYQL